MRKIILLLFVFANCKVSGQTIPFYVPQCGLIAWYPFSGNAIDSTMHGNNGIVTGAILASDRFGHPNSAYRFNGASDYIYVPTGTYPSSLYIPGSVSISAWVATPDYNHGGQAQVFWRGDNAGAHDQYMLYTYGGNTIGMRRDVGTGLTTTQTGYPTAGIDSSFHHFVGTYDSATGNMCVYFDGNLVSSALLPGIESYPTATFFNVIGAVNYSPSSQFFLGRIDDIGVWNRALTLCEVRQLYYAANYHCNDTLHSSRDTAVCVTTGPITLNGRSGYTTYLWNDGSTNSSIIENITGSYYVYSSNSSCGLAIDTFQVTFNKIDTIRKAYDTSVCPDVSEVFLQADPGYISYSWNTGAAGASVTVSAPGNYAVISPDGLCRMFGETFHISLTPLPVVSLGKDTTICGGNSIVLASLQPIGSSYLWSNGSADSSIQVADSGLYSLVVTRDGCSGSDTVKVSVIYPPYVHLGGDTIACKGDEVILHAEGGNGSFLWSNTSRAQNIVVMDPGTFWVADKNQCGTATDTIRVDFQMCDLWLPSAFTPNGDGHNDIVKALGSLDVISDFSLAIFNRFGQRVFYTEDVYQGWDGIYNGEKQDMGTFYYVMQYKVLTKKRLSKGDIQLIR